MAEKKQIGSFILTDHNDLYESGIPGEDAIVLIVDSSEGTIFKNTIISTILTARVYKGGVEVLGSNLGNLGTIKWYKDGGQQVGSGPILTVVAGETDSKIIYTAQLEGN